jgi:ribosome-associated toxin RatA of RatAB toxin-antitoxin module
MNRLRCDGDGRRGGRHLPAVAFLSLLVTHPAAGELLQAPVGPECVACRRDIAPVRADYSDADWTALARGAIITAEKSEQGPSGMEGTVQATGIISRTPNCVWSVLTDFESRPQYVPAMKEVRIVRVEGNRVWLAERMRLFFMNIRYGLINTLQPDAGSLSWVLDDSVEHDIAGIRGSWQLVPLEDGQGTLVMYHAWIDTGRPIPHFIENLLLKRSLPGVVGDLRTEVERRFRR